MAKNKNGQVVKLKAQVKELKSEAKAAKKSEAKILKVWHRLVTGLAKVLDKSNKAVTAKSPKKKVAKVIVKRKPDKKVEDDE